MEVDLVRNGSLEQLLSVLSGNRQFTSWLEMAAPSIPEHFIGVPAVWFGRVGTANINQLWWHYLAGTARLQSQHKLTGGTREDQEKFWAVPLWVVKISEDTRPTRFAQLVL